MSTLAIIALSVGGLLVGGIAGAVWSFRRPDPNPNGLLARKQE